MPGRLIVVSATRQDKTQFERSAYLARSLVRFPESLRPGEAITYSNNGVENPVRGLPEVYNEAIETCDRNDTLLFVHDDVYLNDWFTWAHVDEALGSWDVAGLAGSINPDLTHPSWGLAFDADLRATGWQPGLQRSGTVNHFDYGHPTPSYYGPAPAECILLDGLFLAARAATLRDSGVRFDGRFAFHMYDLDFCRSARQAGLRLGTWPIAVTHNSGGGFETEEFRTAARRYLQKWAGHE
jgi:GT2 family glycosyltransferase